MLLWIAAQDGWVGPRWLTPRMVHVRAERIREYRRKLESAGLIRTTYHRGQGYEYEVVRLEDLPIQHALEEWRQERADFRPSVIALRALGRNRQQFHTSPGAANRRAQQKPAVPR